MFLDSVPFSSIVALLTAAGMLFLGTGVVLWERASRESRVFFVLCAAAVIWQIGFAGMYAAADPATALIWAKVAYLGIPFIAPALFGFSQCVVRPNRRRNGLVRGCWAIAAAFTVVFLADGVIIGMQRFTWGYFPQYGALGVPYLVFFFATLGIAMWDFLRELRDTPPSIHRQRVRLLAIAFGVAYLAVLDYLPTFGVDLYPFGNFAVLVFVGISAWTIGRYRLVDLTPSFAADQIIFTMADPLIVVDNRYAIRIVNAAASSALKIADDALVGRPIDILTPDENGTSLRILCGGSVVRDREMWIRAGDGEQIEVSVSASPLADSAGHPAGTVLIARDIRDRKGAERSLRENEERFRSVIENINDAIIILSLDGKVKYASPSLFRVIGYTPEERLGKSVTDLLHPDDEAAVMEAFDKGSKIPGHTVTGEYRVRHRNGSWRTVEATATNLLHNPSLSGIVIAYHDVTDRHAAEQALRDSEDQLRQSQRLEAVGRLAGGVAHDFNNLLTVINGETQLVLDGALEPEEVRPALQEVVRAGRRAASLTRQLLAFSRKQVLKPEEMNVNASIREMEQMLRRLIGEDITIRIELDPEAFAVLADPGQVDQVLLNLAVNARDAMPEGGVLSIATRNVHFPDKSGERLPGDYVCLTVEDTGCGIPKSIQAQIFEPFFTTKELGKGTGLGLSTVFGIVKQSGGWIEVESEPAHGSRFLIYLPALQGGGLPREVTPVGVSGPSVRGQTILLVEDDEGVRVLVERVLERCGMFVQSASNGREALALVDGGAAIDLVVTDIVMPEMSGYALANELASRRPGLAVLFMSGYPASELSHSNGIGVGTRFLPKPFGPDELLTAVSEALITP